MNDGFGVLKKNKMAESSLNGQSFSDMLTQIIEANLENEQFGVNELAREAGLSRSTLHRKLIKETGNSATDFITLKRLEKANKLLEQSDFTAAEIAYKTGFNSPSYFNKVFKKHYQISPGDLRKGKEVVSVDKPAGAKQSARRLKISVFVVSAVLFAAVLIWAGVHFSKGKTAVAEKSIAILPFDNLSSNDDNQYFADGIVEDLLTRLSSVNNLKVISRTSSEMFRNKGDKTITEIGKILGVGFILEGTVQRESDNIRISVQLIDAKNDDHVLSKQYDRNVNELFKVQREIASAIAAELSPVLTDMQADKLKHDFTQNTKALELYQLGRYHSNKRWIDEYEKGNEYYQKAIAVDPDYALAYAGLADNYHLMALQGWIDQTEGKTKAVDFAMKALELDPDLAEPHAVLGSLYTWMDRNWKKAEEELLLAIKLNASYSTAHQYYADFLFNMCRRKEARDYLNKALELDPLSYIIRNRSAIFYFHQGQFEEALAENRICENLVKDHQWTILLEAWIYIQMGNEQAAFDNLKRYSIKNNAWSLEMADSIFNKGGLDAVIRWRLDSGLYEPEYEKRFWYAILGEDEKAMEMLEEAMKAGVLAPFETNRIEYKNLRSNPRFIAIRKKMGLPPLNP
jgi:TolB-like protein/AraC-like DNA-binding protein